MNEGRIPPQAIIEEEAVLGALMIDKYAINSVLSSFKPSNFYKEKHVKIAEAIMTLHSDMEPIDILTVMEQLKKQGDLEKIGGPFTLTQLTNRVATSANTEYHLKIVNQKAFRRDLISKASKMIEMAYDETQDVFDVLDEAEQMAMEANSATSDAVIKPIEAINTEVLEDAYKAKENPGKLLGVPSGFTDIDRKIGGWKGGNLIVVAARPAMGKTALILNMAKNAAEQGNKIGVFSLEMPAKELAQRIISSDAEIETKDISEATLNQYGWIKLDNSVSKINKLGIYICDKPGISLSELRTLSRQVKLKYGLDEIAIDYLQLMSGSGKKGQNREGEISEISRGLKGLAKELDVPVIALSQLSRAVETRGGDKRPMLSDLRECLPIDEWVSTPEGPLMLNDKPNQIITTSGLDQYISNCEFIEKKYNSVYLIKSQYGTFRATANHLVLTGCGWKKVKNLSPDRDVLASPKIIPHANKGKQPHARFLGWMIGNGSFSGTPSLIYRKELDLDVKKEVEKFGVRVNYRKCQKSDNVYDTYLSNGVESGSLPNPIMSWIRYLGIEGCTSHNKYIPSEYLGSSDETHIELLIGLWESDGTVTRGCAKYATTSELLARQVSWLLLTIGVRSTVNKYNNIWEVRCAKADNPKMEKIVSNHIRFNRLSKPSARYIDPSPSIFIEMISELTDNLKIRLQKKGDGSFKSIAKESIREIIKEHPISTIKESPYMSMDHMGWGRIYSVVKLESKVRVCDLHVPVTHNFITNGIVVHNSGAIEQDADIVSFLYRPEYYGFMQDEDGNSTQGLAEFIISKFRGGSTGTVLLKFKGKYTKFDNHNNF